MKSILPYALLDGGGLVLVSSLVEACEFASLELVLEQVDLELFEELEDSLLVPSEVEVEDVGEQHDVEHVSVCWQLDGHHGELHVLHVPHDELHDGLHDDHDDLDHHQVWSLQGLSQVKEQHYACYLFNCLIRTEHRT